MELQTPAAKMRAAATKLRETAGKATPGPWRMHDTHLNHGGHTATVLTERDDLNETELVAWLPTMSHEPWDEKRNAWNNAAWMALVSPALAEPIAVWLEECAEGLEAAARVATKWPDGEGISDPVQFYDEPSSAARAYAVARVILGEVRS